MPLAAALLACGCGGSPSDSLKNAESWASTARLLVDARLAGSTSATYTAVSLERASEEATSLGEALGKAELPADERERARGAARGLAALTARLAAAADADDGAALSRGRAPLDALRDTLSSLADRETRREEAP